LKCHISLIMLVRKVPSSFPINFFSDFRNGHAWERWGNIRTGSFPSKKMH
jgi:hypothetical protein